MDRPAKILVVDDHVPLANAYARVLATAGHEPLVAHSADIALREAELHHPDAIILDLAMPFVNGVGLLYRLRMHQALRQIPVLIVTGQTLTPEAQAEIADLKAEVRFKPIGMTDLVAAAALLLDRHQPTSVQDVAHAPGHMQ
jgi:DNA-binding response OmpR family regulator